MVFRNFTYQQNAGASGSTARLNSVCEESGPTCPLLRSYTTDAAGYLDGIQAGANLLDFTFDASGQLGSVQRGTRTLTNTYDGRGFLANATDSKSLGYVKPSYSSQGLLYSLEKLPVAGGTVERHNVLYFAGRPVAIWKKVGTGTPTTTYITTDHLGTPVFAFNQTGAAYWSGGLEPFGRDWQEGTANDMLTKGIFLRFPGQWDDDIFSGATLGADIYYNVHRWYEQQTERYTQADPVFDAYRGKLLGALQGAIPRTVFSALINEMDQNHFTYARANPVANNDPLGLTTQTRGCDSPIPDCIENTQRKACCRCHDICYFNNNCNAQRDWARTILFLVNPPAAALPTPNCIGCNLQVVACFGLSFNIVTSQITLPCQFSEPLGLYGTP